MGTSIRSGGPQGGVVPAPGSERLSILFPQGVATRPAWMLAQFAYLQLLDVLTTLAFLGSGVREANPLVQLVLVTAGSPVAGLIVLKVLACAGGLYCAFSGRFRVLRCVNMFFAWLVVWNLIALLGR
ncbi:MAG: DUF5658 family protein [Bryobacteraceae bacterium]